MVVIVPAWAGGWYGWEEMAVCKSRRPFCASMFKANDCACGQPMAGCVSSECEDETAVDPSDQKEVATYRCYLAAKQAAPASKAALLAYNR